VSRRIRRHPAVEDDIIEMARFIAKGSVNAALRYWDRVEEAIRWLLEHPNAGGPRDDLDDPALAAVRSWPVTGFRKHLILYEVEASGIYVLMVTHGARDYARLLKRRRGG
jgi:toxin ParE1/3/4